MMEILYRGCGEKWYCRIISLCKTHQLSNKKRRIEKVEKAKIFSLPYGRSDDRGHCVAQHNLKIGIPHAAAVHQRRFLDFLGKPSEKLVKDIYIQS